MAIVKLLKNVKPDGAVIVTTRQEVALATIKKEISFCKKMGVSILGIVENMGGFICPCCKVSCHK
jgi:Mrp family chromosome partitioning ATPase